jgi:hypothetical protein
MAKEVSITQRLINGAAVRVTCQECSDVLSGAASVCLAEPDRPPFKRLYTRALGSTGAQEQRQAQVVRFPPLATL